MNKIKKLSFIFRILLQIIFVAWPILLAVAWIEAPKAFHWVIFDFNVIPKEYMLFHPLTFWHKFLGFCVDMLLTSISLLILYFLIKLFKMYEKGEIFTLQNVRMYRNMGYTLVLGQIIVKPIWESLMGLVITLQNPPGHRFMNISFSGINAGLIIMGIIIILISWIMAEAYRLQEEQRFII